MSPSPIILQSGNSIPPIGFGVYLITVDDCAQAVYDALAVGYRQIDSASCYDNEKECAEGIIKFLQDHPQVKRSDIFYTTKIWTPDFGYHKCKAAIKRQFGLVSGLGYIDLILVHTPNTLEDPITPEQRLETYQALQEAVDENIVKDIGISNYGVKHIEELLQWQGLTVKPSVNQIELNPWLQHQDIVDLCHKQGIVIQTFSPLTAGQRLKDPQLVSLAEKYNKSPAQIIIRWNIQKKYIPLPKSVVPARIKENFDVFDFSISDEDMASLGDPNEYFVTVPEWDPTVLP